MWQMNVVIRHIAILQIHKKIKLAHPGPALISIFQVIE